MTEITLDFAKQGGLIPVIVTDYQTGQVLMLAYMNQESYDLTLKTKEMHYWSRSRQEIWHKGETSGHFQKVKSIKTDCDCDTLLVAVEQIGAACHTGAYSCFFNDIL
ncbi:phosphoribosyl-AMP cyclohydrolase [Streptococcus downei]|uniref:Phosphoribosyl-AMP cyclohydrolase n=1 Tax=Streptococcus downei MFe28 TaxID=764290 RepID=A0A380JEP4_STRDO|nr:phosphoribosyl-AMP cyclohydrolase [Streptococcus downei]EFQ57623.1 phosphoribosyl-AMP cyclohydrolase [Streptococcus downei F0415]SUN36617.1 phosphoribosyl-AMP cyclohydrolase [Streptococcus downei MFe28]